MLSDDFKPCLKGAVIANQVPFRSDVILLRQLISAPNDVYKELYLTTLYAFMELCQAIPSTITQPASKSLLEKRLSLTIAALKLRRGKMLPLNSDSETIAEQEPLWTYALFTAGLLWRLSDMQQHCSIELYKSAGERLGFWHPLSGNLAESDTYYKIVAQPSALILETIPFQALIVGKTIPSIGLRWLAEYPTVFSLWWEVITDQTLPNNPLMSLLQTATQQMGLAETHHPTVASKQNDTTPEDNAKQVSVPHMTTEHVLDALNVWLSAQLNSPSSLPLFLRISQGLFVSVTALNLFIEQKPIYVSLEVLLDQLKNTLLSNITPEEELEESKETENRENLKHLFFRYRSIHFEQRQVSEGVVFPEKYLCPELKVIPQQKNFVPDISL